MMLRNLFLELFDKIFNPCKRYRGIVSPDATEEDPHYAHMLRMVKVKCWFDENGIYNEETVDESNGILPTGPEITD